MAMATNWTYRLRTKDKDGNLLKVKTATHIKREVATMDDGLKFQVTTLMLKTNMLDTR